MCSVGFGLGAAVEVGADATAAEDVAALVALGEEELPPHALATRPTSAAATSQVACEDLIRRILIRLPQSISPRDRQSRAMRSIVVPMLNDADRPRVLPRMRRPFACGSASLLALAALTLAACGGSDGTAAPRTGASISPSTRQSASSAAQAPSSTAATSQAPAPAPPRPKPRAPSHPRLLAGALGSGPSAFVPAVTWGGRTAAWVARSPSGVALLSFDQRLVRLALHSGTIDAGATGWRFGPSIGRSERQRVIAAFNGGFRLDVGAGGFESYGRVAVPLQAGLGSIVTYADGSTDIGSWHQEVPRAGGHVASVRQNLQLLIDHGHAAGTLDCLTCWGATLGGVSDPARSALGITRGGRLVWAGGERLTAAALAVALLGAHVVRAVELDINPEWVAAYLYGHRRGGPPAPVPIVPGQPGVPGQFLAPYSRDFFTITAR